MRRRVIIALASIVTLSGCTPKQEAMPILVEVRAGGWADVTFAVCSGDRLRSVALVDTSLPEKPSINYSAPRDEVSANDHVEHVKLDGVTLVSGEIAPGLVPGEVHPFASSIGGLGAAAKLFVDTRDFAAQVAFGDLKLTPGNAYVITGGGSADRTYVIDHTTSARGNELIGGWCASTRTD